MGRSGRAVSRRFNQPPSKMKKLRYLVKSAMEKGKSALSINKNFPSDVSIVHGHAIHGLNNQNEGLVHSRNMRVGTSNALFLGVFQQCRVDILDSILNVRFDEDDDEEDLKYEAKRAAKDIFYRAVLDENRGGFAYLFVLNSNRFVGAYSGDYRVVICKRDQAIHVKTPNSFLKGLMSGRIIGRNRYGPRLLSFSLKVDPDTEIVILGSNGLWQNIEIQEAVDLIRNIEEAESAAQHLVELANSRTRIDSAGGFPISCVVIRCQRHISMHGRGKDSSSCSSME